MGNILEDLSIEDMRRGLYMDKYFLRSKEILREAEINPTLRFQVFARRGGIVKGVDEAADFIREITEDKATIYALKNRMFYETGEPLMKIEGQAQDLIEWETGYLQIIAGALTEYVDMDKISQNAKAIVEAAENKPVIYFGARHFATTLDEKIAKICKEAGFVGCSTDIGARAWNNKGLGTVPHALILAIAAYMQENGIQNNPTVEAAKLFDEYIEPSVPRIALIDTFGWDVYDAVATAKAVSSLAGVRIDTCGERYAQGALEIQLPEVEFRELNIPKRYIRSKGVSIAGTWILRKGLNEAGYENVESTVSAGFNAAKIKAFVKADKVFQRKYGSPLFSSIGTGSVYGKAVNVTSDICAFFNKRVDAWVPMIKTGRSEMFSNKLIKL